MLYKVKLKKTGELRSIKIIKKGDHSMSTEKAIITEIELLETTDHPNILKIYEFYDCPENICIIGELGRGGPLSKCIKKIINESETVKAHLMFQLLSTVTYCHAMNIMHRDIKPEHILIEKKSKDGFYYIKLIDFGTAKVFINLQHQLVGSIHTMAPEVIAGKYNEKCDLWSCGIILYVLFKGEYPFTGNNQNELISNISNGYIDLSSPPFDTVSPEAKDLIQKMIKVDMKTRISASKALEHSWFKKLHIKDSFFELDIEKARRSNEGFWNNERIQSKRL